MRQSRTFQYFVRRESSSYAKGHLQQKQVSIVAFLHVKFDNFTFLPHRPSFHQFRGHGPIAYTRVDNVGYAPRAPRQLVFCDSLKSGYLVSFVFSLYDGCRCSWTCSHVRDPCQSPFLPLPVLRAFVAFVGRRMTQFRNFVYGRSSGGRSTAKKMELPAK